ncbi:MAG TPA: hypothetical protein VGF30_16790 [Bacteroidia bacterium]
MKRYLLLLFLASFLISFAQEDPNKKTEKTAIKYSEAETDSIRSMVRANARKTFQPGCINIDEQKKISDESLRNEQKSTPRTNQPMN